MKDDGGPAFPAAAGNSTDYEVLQSGMSLRDWFAGMALSGILAWDAVMNRGQTTRFEGDDDSHILAGEAYRIADALLKVRASTPKEGE